MSRRMLFLLAIFLLLPFTHTHASIVISELLWSGSDLSTADEWIELTNTGSGAVSLSGWTLTKLSSGNEVDMLTLPASVSVGSGEIFLISNNDEDDSRLGIQADHVTTAVSLSNTKLLIRLYDGPSSGGTLVDAADDGVGAPFAGSNTLPKASMERIDLSGSGQQKSNWQTATTFVNFDDGVPLFGTPGATNGSGPSVDTFAPAEATNLAAEVSSGTLLVSWTPSISLDLASQTLLFSGTGQVLASTVTGVTFPGLGTGITFTLKSTDTLGNTSSGTSTISTLFPNVKLTEVLANPTGADTEEWIEVGNVGSETVDISGWILDEGNSPGDYEIPSGTTLKPDEYLSFRKSTTGLPLGNQGEELSLTRGFTTIDTWSYPETAEEVSYGRRADDLDTFQAFCVPTEGKQNDVFEPNPEITIQSGALDGTNKVTVNLIATVQTGSTVHANCSWDYGDGFTSSSCNPPSHTIRSVGSFDIRLTYTDFCNNVIERSVTATVSSTPPSVPEQPGEPPATGGGGGSRSTGGGGGGGGGRTTCAATFFKGIRISEFLPNPIGKDAEGEWIELENTLNQSVDLCGWEIDDSEEGSRVYPLDTYQLAAHAFLLLPRKKTKIALNNTNESVRLFGPRHTLIEEIHYEKSREGESFALRSDGLFVWTPFLTPEAPNTFRTAQRRNAHDRAIVSAALPNPDGKDAGKEWIEITNVGEAGIDLTGWQLDNRDDSRRPYGIENIVLKSGDVYRFTTEETGIQLTNKFDQARLLDPDRNVISLLSWHEAVSGRVYRPTSPGETIDVLVVKVIDGDTIEVDIEGKKEKVRLIGVDTPETVHPSKPVERFGKEASAFTRERLEGKTVTLQFDEERRGKYDRLLAYVLLKDGTNFNGELIRRGYAYAYLRFPFRLSDLFAAYEAEARKAKLGLWADEEVSVYVQQSIEQIEQESDQEGIQSSESGSTVEFSEEDSDLVGALHATPLQVVLSEVMPNPPKEGLLAGLGEYLELFNPNDEAVPLAGWILDDNPEGSSKPYTFSDDIVIEAMSYLLLCKGSGCDFPLKISLNNEGEEISLTAPNGEVISSIIYPKLKRGVTYTLHPRRSAYWCTSSIATPGKKNVCRGSMLARTTAVTKSTGRGEARLAPTKSTQQTIKKRPTDFLRKRYRALLSAPNVKEKPDLSPLLASLLPQIIHPEFPDTLTHTGTLSPQRHLPLSRTIPLGILLLTIPITAFMRQKRCI